MARLLVVDDDEAMRYSTARLLQLLGHEVEEAADGEEALEMLLGAEFDLVLVDILMPVMDGLETIDELRRQGAQVPVIAWTGHQGGRLDYLEAALHIGASGVLLKPFSSQALTTLVEELLAGPTGRHALHSRPQLS